MKRTYLLAGAIIIIAVFSVAATLIYLKITGRIISPPASPPLSSSAESNLVPFHSEKEFRDYIAKAQEQSGITNGEPRLMLGEALPSTGALAPKAGAMDIGAVPQRVSETNVQVKGIDEPDIVKTDGQEIYFSAQTTYPIRIMQGTSVSALGVPSAPEKIAPGTLPIPQEGSGVNLIRAFPLNQLAKEAKLDKSGDLLLSGKTLVVLSSDNKINAYNVADPAKPQSVWHYEAKDNSSIVTARLYKDRIYLVMRTGVNNSHPCPVLPLSFGEKALSIPCVEIYHPQGTTPVDATYTVLTINPASGEVMKKVSFVGSAGTTNIYMSENNIYVGFTLRGDTVSFLLNFYLQNKDLVTPEIIAHLEKLTGLDISAAAKNTELSVVLENYRNSMDNDARLKWENEMQNRLNDYLKKHNRELEKTGLVRIGTDNLAIEATGSVPGSLLNQFAMDEYQKNLRLATTVGGGWWGAGMGAAGESANDLYILDQNLNIKGAVKDLAAGERIYAVRFIGNRGYLVTFKQVDPFFVVDLSDPSGPRVQGQLKIPGYSSYLHPLKDNLLLGVGMENQKVKVVLFDVSNTENPQEADKYNLDEYWTDVSNTHHAFLADPKHQIFFLPGSRGGYIFSYAGNKLTMVKAVSGINPRRALYINDYLYILADNKIVVVNENDWQSVNQLEL